MSRGADRRWLTQPSIAHREHGTRGDRGKAALRASLSRVLTGAAAIALLAATAFGSVQALGSDPLTQPDAPTDVAVSEVTSATATVTWEPAEGAAAEGVDFEVHVNDEPHLTTAETTAELTDLEPNTTYEVEVFSAGEGGALSEPAEAEPFVTDDAEGAALGTEVSLSPETPDGGNGWYVTRPRVTLTSVPATDAATIYYSIDSTETMTPYTEPFAAPVGEYTLYFESRMDGRETATNSIELKVDAAAVEAPEGVSAKLTAGMVSLTWEPVEPTESGIERYEVYENGTLSAETTGTVITMTGLEPQTTYEYTVTAVNGAEQVSEQSSGATVTTDPTPFALPPAAVFARGLGGDTALLNWAPASATIGDVSYVVRRSADGVTFSRVATITAGAPLTLTDEGLSSSREYQYTVSTVDDRGEGMPSAAATAHTGAAGRPLGVSVTPSDGGVSISWQPSDNPAVVGYYVYRSDASLSQPATLTPTGTNLTSYLDTGLENGRTYWYRVAAFDDRGVIGDLSVEAAGAPVLAVRTDLSPHGTAEEPANSCMRCHSPHGAVGPSLSRFEEAGFAIETTSAIGAPRANAAAQAACLSCHTGETGRDMRTPFVAEGGSKHPVMIDEAEGLLRCGSCHRSHRRANVEDPALLDVRGAESGNQVCYGCHGQGSGLRGGDLRVFEGSLHSGLEGDSRVGTTCSACHEPHASPNEKLLTYSGAMNCVRCHDTAGPADAPGIADLATGGAEYRSTHVATPEEQLSTGSRMSCSNCHNAMSMTADAPLVDPDNPSPSGTWTSADRNAFCLRCHDGTLPTAAQTGTWASSPRAKGNSASVVDIASAFQTNVHGHGTSDGDGPSFLRPHMGYKKGDVLGCQTCHGAHGTANPMSLRTDVPKADGSAGASGALVAPVPGGGYDMRFFCSSCHDFSPSNHLAATDGSVPINGFPMDCTASGCHRHTMAPAGTSTPTTGTKF